MPTVKCGREFKPVCCGMDKIMRTVKCGVEFKTVHCVMDTLLPAVKCGGEFETGLLWYGTTVVNCKVR